MELCLLNMRLKSPMVVLLLMMMCLSLSCAGRTLPEQHSQELVGGDSYSKAAAAAIDPNKDCASNYPKLDFKPVTSVCSPKVPATEACCAAFSKFACQFPSQVNNYNSICPILFMAYLNYAGGYQDGHFIGPCIDGKAGLCV